MKYRMIPKLNLKAGVVGLGGEHLDGKPYADVEHTLHAAMDAGVNMLDLFMPGEEIRTNIGRALEGRRERIMIQGMIGSTDVNKQYDISRDPALCRKYFEDLLRFLGTDYIDFGMLFFIDTDAAFEKVFEEGTLLRYAQDLKKAGTIRGIGASAHDPVTARRMVETGEIDLLLFSVNPAFDLMPLGLDIDTMLSDKGFDNLGSVQPARAALYEACEREGVAITTMKTLGAGKLLSAAHTPFKKPLTPAQCIRYALDRPAVVSTLIGAASPEEIQESLKYFEMSEEELSYSEILGGERSNFLGNCLYCNHCLPCPNDIDIALVNRYLEVATLGGENTPPSIREYYTALKAHGGDCIACGSCETRCPFSVPIIENMAKAVAVFGS
ncbi:MAG: aldo/keto reductase [Clostridiales bacterium]|nr:aldo/keto reductase [Clostridiales bacterium]